MRLGTTHEAAGDTELAQIAWRRALTILEELGHPDSRPVRARLSTADGERSPH